MPESNQRGLIHFLLPVLMLALLGGGIYFLFTMQKPATQNTSNPTQSNTTTTSAPVFLTLDSPNANTTVVDDTVVIRGKTLPNTTVTMYNDTDDAMIQSDSSGNFEGKLSLGSGENNLVITAFGENGDEKSLSLKMTYNPS
jgi:hypothetical protein